jgi:MAGE family
LLTRQDLDRLVKNFVRYALACEFTRTPIRRDEISKKGARRVKLRLIGSVGGEIS